jgi:methionyl-tRNA formyltransferase
VSRSDHPWHIIFMGTPEFAVPSLEALLRSQDDVVAVISQPDRAVGRGRHLTPPAVKKVALARGVPVLQPPTLRDTAVHAEIAAAAPDLIVVAAYGKILPTQILDVPAHGCINVHASLLPRHRGAAPVQWAILSGDRSTGITIMRMNPAMDEGDILLQRSVPIEPVDTAETLGGRLAHLGAALLVEAVVGLKVGTIKERPQDSSAATLAPRIQKSMGRIDWTKPAAVIEREVRAFQPWPTAYTTMNGKQLKALRAQVGVPPPARPKPPTPGTIIASGEAGIVVVTGTDPLVLTVVQLEGHRPLQAGEFVRGHPVKPGTVLGT